MALRAHRRDCCAASVVVGQRIGFVPKQSRGVHRGSPRLPGRLRAVFVEFGSIGDAHKDRAGANDVAV